MTICRMVVEKIGLGTPTVTTAMGNDVIVDQPHIDQCHVCGKNGTFGIVLLDCAPCHVAKYCTLSCQEKHWLQYEVYCKALDISNRSNEIYCDDA